MGSLLFYGRQNAYPALLRCAVSLPQLFPLISHGLDCLIGPQGIGPYLEDRTPIHFAEMVAQEFSGRLPASYG